MLASKKGKIKYFNFFLKKNAKNAILANVTPVTKIMSF